MPQRLKSAPRQSYGSVFAPQTENNIQISTSTRRMADVQANVFIQNGQQGTGLGLPGQGGDGIMDSIRSAVAKGKKIRELGAKASNLATGEIGTALRNLIPSSDENARPGFPGEKHALLRLPNGRFGMASYMGPGTAIEKRLARGDPPRTQADKVAQAHDIRYSLAKTQDEVSAADRKMISKLKQIERVRGDSKFNTQLGMRMIQAKLALESRGIVKPGLIATFGDIDDGSIPAFQEKIGELEQEGFGLPGDMLRMKLLRQMKKKKKKKVKGLSPPGGGLNIPGGKIDMRSMVKWLAPLVGSKILPMLMKHLSGSGLKLAGQGIPKKKLASLLHMRMLKSLNNGSSKSKSFPNTKGYMVGTGASDIAKKLKPMAVIVAKTLLPIIMKMALAKMKGSGVETFAELKRRTENPSIIASLGNKLSSGLFKLLKNMVMSKIKGDKVGSGFGSFFKGFKKGFMKVLNPALKVAKTLAPLAPLLL